jgi:hypothetical protein
MVPDGSDPINKFYLVMAALNEQQSRMVQHGLDIDVTADSYSELCKALLAYHSLTPFQKVHMEHLEAD